MGPGTRDIPVTESGRSQTDTPGPTTQMGEAAATLSGSELARMLVGRPKEPSTVADESGPEGDDDDDSATAVSGPQDGATAAAAAEVPADRLAFYLGREPFTNLPRLEVDGHEFYQVTGLVTRIGPYHVLANVYRGLYGRYGPAFDRHLYFDSGKGGALYGDIMVAAALFILYPWRNNNANQDLKAIVIDRAHACLAEHALAPKPPLSKVDPKVRYFITKVTGHEPVRTPSPRPAPNRGAHPPVPVSSSPAVAVQRPPLPSIPALPPGVPGPVFGPMPLIHMPEMVHLMQPAFGGPGTSTSGQVQMPVPVPLASPTGMIAMHRMTSAVQQRPSMPAPSPQPVPAPTTPVSPPAKAPAVTVTVPASAPAPAPAPAPTPPTPPSTVASSPPPSPVRDGPSPQGHTPPLPTSAPAPEHPKRVRVRAASPPLAGARPGTYPEKKTPGTSATAPTNRPRRVVENEPGDSFIEDDDATSGNETLDSGTSDDDAAYNAALVTKPALAHYRTLLGLMMRYLDQRTDALLRKNARRAETFAEQARLAEWMAFMRLPDAPSSSSSSKKRKAGQE